MGSGAGTASKLKRRYTGFSSIPRGIAVPEVGVPAAVLVNAKLTASRGAHRDRGPARFSLKSGASMGSGQKLVKRIRLWESVLYLVSVLLLCAT